MTSQHVGFLLVLFLVQLQAASGIQSGKRQKRQWPTAQGCLDFLDQVRDRSDDDLLEACSTMLPRELCLAAHRELGPRPWTLERTDAACNILYDATEHSQDDAGDEQLREDVQELSAVRQLHARAGWEQGIAGSHGHGASFGANACPFGWVNLMGPGELPTCYSPVEVTSTVVPTDTCVSGDCAAVFAKCEQDGAVVATKEELHYWLDHGGNRPRSYGVTSTTKQEKSNFVMEKLGLTRPWRVDYIWITEGDTGDHGWYRSGCCGSNDRYFVCTKPAATMTQKQLDLAIENKTKSQYATRGMNPIPEYGWTDPSASFTGQTSGPRYYQNYTGEIHEDATPQDILRASHSQAGATNVAPVPTVSSSGVPGSGAAGAAGSGNASAVPAWPTVAPTPAPTVAFAPQIPTPAPSLPTPFPTVGNASMPAMYGAGTETLQRNDANDQDNAPHLVGNLNGPPPGAEMAGYCIQNFSRLFEWQTSDCVYSNMCDATLFFRCPWNLACVHVSHPGGYWSTTCNGHHVTDICYSGTCEVWKATLNPDTVPTAEQQAYEQTARDISKDYLDSQNNPPTPTPTTSPTLSQLSPFNPPIYSTPTPTDAAGAGTTSGFQPEAPTFPNTGSSSSQGVPAFTIPTPPPAQVPQSTPASVPFQPEFEPTFH